MTTLLAQLAADARDTFLVIIGVGAIVALGVGWVVRWRGWR
jgi:hypothetical protein